MLLKIIELTGTQTAKERNHAESAIDGVISGRLGPGSRSAQKSSAKDREGFAGQCHLGDFAYPGKSGPTVTSC
jgi:hypothetical protein